MGSVVNRLTERCEHVAADGRTILVGYLPAGFPDAERFTDCVSAAFSSGADVMEIALPAPPAELDGPVIRAASVQGRKELPDLAGALRRAVAGRASERDPLIAMAYRAAVDGLAADAVVQVCATGGVDAVLLPEHGIDEQLAMLGPARAAGLEQVLFVRRRSDVTAIAHSAVDRPVIYLQSATAPTGGALDIDRARARLDDVRAALGRDATVLVGFGVSGRDDVRQLGGTSADGVVIGTAMVEAAADGPAGVAQLVADLRAAVAAPRLHDGRPPLGGRPGSPDPQESPPRPIARPCSPSPRTDP